MVIPAGGCKQAVIGWGENMTGRKIIVLGYYHKGNLGDDILEKAITRLLGDCDLTFCGDLPTAATLNEFDHVILGGGSVWPNSGFNSLVLKRRLKTPFSLLGISCRAVIDPTITARVLEEARVIIVRDLLTKEAFQNESKIRVAPDLSWLQPLPIADPAPISCAALNLRSWGTSDWDPRAVVEVTRSAFSNVIALPFYHGVPRAGTPDAATDLHILSQAGLPYAVVCPVCGIGRVGVVVAMRFHALVLAAQSGVPFVGFDYHPKTRAFFKEIGLSQFCLPLNDLDGLRRALKEVLHRHSEIRNHLISRRSISIRDAEEVYGAARRAIMAGRPQVTFRRLCNARIKKLTSKSFAQEFLTRLSSLIAR